MHILDSRLKVENLRVYYFTGRGKVRAVDDISFEINGNESIGIVGESASGKSTLGAAIIRSVNPPGRIIEGKILVQGKNMLDLSDSNFNREMRWKKIAVVFQGAMNSLDPVYRISEQLQELLKEHNIKGNFEQLIYQALNDVGLHKSIADRYPHELSGGMKQRVVIAMALLGGADLDARLTMRDVILAREGSKVTLGDTAGANYASAFRNHAAH